MTDYRKIAREHLSANGNKSIVEIVADLLSRGSGEDVFDKLSYRVKNRQLEKENEKLFDLLSAVHLHFSESIEIEGQGQGPGHSHRTTGIWDESGMPCEWCKIWSDIDEIVRSKIS